MSDTPRSKKSKVMGKQPDLRQFIFKKMKSQDNSCSSTPPVDSGTPSSNASASPSYDSPQINENDMNLGGSNTDNVPLENEELVYDVELLPHDPGKRINIMDYPSNQRNAIRRAYILKKPCQPKTHNFPQRDLGGPRPRRFVASWFDKWDWLEYSIEKNAAFCFVCYLFKNDIEVNVGGDAFVEGGFRSWNKSERFKTHVGVVSKVIFENAPGNCQLTSPMIQKDIINCCDKETTKRIIEEIGDDYFDILADESSDVSQKEQLALCLCYVEKKTGKVVKRFLGLVHVGDTTALSLRSAIIFLLVDHSLSPSKI
ncbi:uncharacterized protein LOC104897818 [Beta vulgaris subsp. vulgaris]|uniref:uncharacterized protein LOC104897818 n=1 Tax=Beta vulgaris subsp. vulgaris TaxID=3555 RepID=UPI0020366C08|nr:uncharacterized protein LOC104897818 [Beta vulgaris subsp. vulgaris]